MEKEKEEGTEKSVTEQALRESRAKFVSITLLFKGMPIRTHMTVKIGGYYPLLGEKMDFNPDSLQRNKCYTRYIKKNNLVSKNKNY